MGNTSSKNYSAQENDEFVTVKTYNGETKAGKRHGRGFYLYPNGDMYDGEWRKSKKYGKGVYTFAADGKRLDGFFYKDEYIGKEPNEKIIKRMQKKQRLLDRGEPSMTEQTDLSNDDVLEDHQPPRLKSEGSSRRRIESFKRTKWLRDKYNIAGRMSNTRTDKNTDGLDSDKDMKRSFNHSDKRTVNKQEEAKERRESKRLRESIRAKYKLPRS